MSKSLQIEFLKDDVRALKQFILKFNKRMKIDLVAELKTNVAWANYGYGRDLADEDCPEYILKTEQILQMKDIDD
jgi:hypothetical protein